jgi:hypothetical protein
MAHVALFSGIVPCLHGRCLAMAVSLPPLFHLSGVMSQYRFIDLYFFLQCLLSAYLKVLSQHARGGIEENNYKPISRYVGFEVFTAVVMKSIILWDITPCSPSSFNRPFGGTYRLHLQGRKNKLSKI